MKKKLAFLWVRIRRRRPSTGTMVDLDRPSDWQKIFINSRVNGGTYYEREFELPLRMTWPKATWFQKRLKGVKDDNAMRSMQKTISS